MLQKKFFKTRANSLNLNFYQNNYLEESLQSKITGNCNKSFNFRNDNEESFENEGQNFKDSEDFVENEKIEAEYFNSKIFGGENCRKKEWTFSQNPKLLNSENSVFSEKVKKIKRELTEEVSQLIINSLKNNCIFAPFTMSETQM